MMPSVYMIADLHLGHENVAKWRGFQSIEEHDQLIIDNWNKTVNPTDTVWILGDCVLGGVDNVDKLGLLNGRKKIVMGNHDTQPSERYLQHVERLYGAYSLKNYMLTHIPIHPLEFPRFAGNIHGHLHATKMDDLRYFCVSCEQVNYTPMLFHDIIDIFKQRRLLDNEVGNA